MYTLRTYKEWISYVLIFAVLSHFGGGHTDPSVFVLCFGSDGHVAVERISQDHDANANKALQHKDRANAYFTDGDSPCTSPCTDVPLGDDDHASHVPLTDLSKTSLDVGILPLFFIAFLLVPYARVITRRRFSSDPPITDSRLLALRSIVLLI
ncbi:MAG: hypothetical protein KGZ88_09345 [Methylomicrobium sp.]|nr:hypothetical protein [Methylomicrobium sp.]